MLTGLERSRMLIGFLHTLDEVSKDSQVNDEVDSFGLLHQVEELFKHDGVWDGVVTSKEYSGPIVTKFHGS